MKCPYCQYRDSKVVDSRDAEASIRRRRECLKCFRRFTTYERVEPASLMVIKRDGRREEFNRDKLLMGLRKACDKRPISPSAIEHIVEEIEGELQARPANEVASAEIGELAMARLKTLDQIAYIRFASAYREFADIDRLRDEFDKMAREREEERYKRDQLSLFNRDEMERLIESTKS